MNSRTRKKIVILSILLHILFFLIWEGAVKLNWFAFEVIPPEPDKATPIVFDLRQPERPREVIETPRDAKVTEQQKQAKFLSDKNALARNPETKPDLPVDEAFARGDFNTHELPKPRGPEGEKVPEEVKDRDKEEEEKETEEKPEESYGDLLRYYNVNQPLPKKEGVRNPALIVTHDNPESRALDMGGMSFNTYNWDFAPYLLMLKKRIQANIHPPQAFTLLGAISGQTLLRFKIYPNGEMQDLVILKYQGHESLMQTSNLAVEVSAPFPRLPSDFPEPYLEITAQFAYFVK